MKTRRIGGTTPKRGKVPSAARPHGSSAPDIQRQLDLRTRELAEALEQQVVAGDILRIIASSPSNAQPVFDSIAHGAARLCQAQFCHVFRYDGELIHFSAHHGLPGEGVDAIRRAYPIPPGRTSAAARAILNGAIEQIPDVHQDPDYKHSRLAQVVTYNSIVAVPMLKGGRSIGAIAVARSESGYFPARQVELLRTFAEQAVIAIENMRLFEEAQARTHEVSEALDQVKATSEVLHVVSSSPTDLQAALGAIAESAARLLDVSDADIMRLEGDGLRLIAKHGSSRQWPVGSIRQISRNWVTGRSVIDQVTVHVPDLQVAERDFPEGAAFAKNYGHRTTLATPLLRQGKSIGAILIRRVEVAVYRKADCTAEDVCRPGSDRDRERPALRRSADAK
jgi:two-component system, NtrC family, sensor kinase